MQAKPKIRYYTERNSFGVSAGVVLLILSILFRLISYWGRWQNLDQTEQLIYIGLPLISALLFILCLLLLGKIALWSTAVPLLVGLAFFILKAFTFESTLHTVLCVLLYVLIAVLWCGTVFNWIRTKWLLPPLFLAPFVYHIVVEDLPALQNADAPVTFAAGMEEMSVLCIMLALFFVSLGIKKRYKEPKPGEKPAGPPVPAALTDGTGAEQIASDASASPVPETPAQPESKPWAYAPEEPEPEPEPEPESAPEAEPAKSGVFGKLFHRGEKPAPAEPAEPAPAEPAAEAASPVPEAPPVDVDDLPPAQGLTLDPKLEEAFKATDEQA